MTNNCGDVIDGLRISSVYPSSVAAAAGVQPGDLVFALGGVPTPSVSDFSSVLRTCEPGTNLELVLLQNSELSVLTVCPEPMPLETAPNIHTFYTSIKSHGAQLRVISTMPQGKPPWPTVLIFQGLQCESIEQPFDANHLYRRLATVFASNGFACIRLERRGTGDSEGGATQDLDFNTELNDYKTFSQQVAKWEFVNRNEISIFGYSMGGVLASLVATTSMFRALVTFGSIGMPWNLYVLDAARRQRRLAGTDEITIETELKKLGWALELLNVKKMTPQAIQSKEPELSDIVGEYMHSRHYTFFTQLSEIDIPNQWRNTIAPTLVLSGNADYVACPNNQRAIFQALPRGSKVLGSTFLQTPVDHWLRHVDTMEASFHNKIIAQFYDRILVDFKSWFLDLQDNA